MTDNSNLIGDATQRIFRELGAPKDIENEPARRERLWAALEESGLTLAWVDDPLSGASATIADGFEVLRIAGGFAVSVPLAESLLASWLLGQARIALPTGKLSLATSLHDRVEVDSNDRLSGVARSVPFGAEAVHLAVTVPRGSTLCVALVETQGGRIAGGKNLAGDARDVVTFAKTAPAAIAELSTTHEDVLLMCAAARAMQMAGALQAVLDISVAYANERVAFEKPIAKFQSIQHNLAKLAAETAAALAAAGSAADAINSSPHFDAAIFLEVASAKIRVGEAVAIGTAIAHQVHGAIGFSKEHVLHCYTQRLLSWRDDFGDENYWALKLGQLVAGNGVNTLWPLLAAR
jgi:alkylation response protein AidB-like acyl-CoA dehydrogenase